MLIGVNLARARIEREKMKKRVEPPSCISSPRNKSIHRLQITICRQQVSKGNISIVLNFFLIFQRWNILFWFFENQREQLIWKDIVNGKILLWLAILKYEWRMERWIWIMNGDLVVTGTVLRYKLSRIVFCRSWSTPPLGNRVFRYWRRSDVIEPEKEKGLWEREL